MLKNKANIRHIQELLGHSSLDSTRSIPPLPSPISRKYIKDVTHGKRTRTEKGLADLLGGPDYVPSCRL
jgi:site-specific recombinase XerD